MKKIALILISPNIPVPPKGWGAIEKYIWEYKINLEKLGHTVDLLYPDAPDLDTYDIVQVHTWNQALSLYKKNIPYVFSFDDTHAIFYGKSSDLYKGNLEAIRKSQITIVHGEYLLEHFGEPNMVYLRHGANSEVFNYQNLSKKDHNLLCVGRTDQDDRKGLLMAIEAAQKLDLPITIVGPNEHFFQDFPSNYDKLTLLGNTDDEGLANLYNSHTIFLHPSKLETGHPNLTLVESLYCSTPVVGTCNIPLEGMKQISPNLQSLVEGIKEVITNYEDYVKGCVNLVNKKHYDWSSITLDLSNIYSSLLSMKEVLIKEYSSTRKLSIPFKQPITKITLDFTDGPKCTINNGGSQSYQVEFINPNTGLTAYKTTIKNNMWTKASVKYFVPWNIKVIDLSNNKLICDYNFNLKDKRVLIRFDSKSVGDTIAWFPYVEEFRKEHQCHVICSTFHNEWFESQYPEIEFIPIGSDTPDVHAVYNIGWFYKNDQMDLSKNPNDVKSIPLQQACTDILGLPYREIKPKVSIPSKLVPIEGKYVTLAIQSTSQAKYWNYKGGWQKIVDYLISRGYKVVCIDKHPSFGVVNCMNVMPLNVVNKTGCSFEEAISLMSNADLHIGLSSGLSWIAWALNTHVVMISSFSKPYCEFQSNCTRIYNDTPTSGYFNTYKLDPSNWNWYPFKKMNTLEDWYEIETITPEQVINEIKQIL